MARTDSPNNVCAYVIIGQVFAAIYRPTYSSAHCGGVVPRLWIEGTRPVSTEVPARADASHSGPYTDETRRPYEPYARQRQHQLPFQQVVIVTSTKWWFRAIILTSVVLLLNRSLKLLWVCSYASEVTFANEFYDYLVLVGSCVYYCWRSFGLLWY